MAHMNSWDVLHEIAPRCAPVDGLYMLPTSDPDPDVHVEKVAQLLDGVPLAALDKDPHQLKSE